MPEHDFLAPTLVVLGSDAADPFGAQASFAAIDGGPNNVHDFEDALANAR